MTAASRELCPHIIGTNKRGEEVVLAWQFGGESSGPAAAMAMPEAGQRQRRAPARGPLA